MVKISDMDKIMQSVTKNQRLIEAAAMPLKLAGNQLPQVPAYVFSTGFENMKDWR